ncbi:hypothetical protein EB796_011687 [Bugula neritina]|uniref:Uncharacterized protein n=1 Tax=Bugula neritina TaxID=10212 RepID=A0A7J7JXE7_BUGNE|nr:hypothetical protein EB796_011687 [Bugula neritina]
MEREILRFFYFFNPGISQSNHVTADDDDLSDLSEDDDNLYPDGENEEDVNLIQPNLKTTRNLRIKYLFSNAEKVFKMTRNRGKALIINNKNFNQRPDLCREGSDADVEKMSFMLKSLKFDVETHTDLKAEFKYVCFFPANIEENPERSGLAAAQEEETEAVSSTHSEADDDDIVYPETPIVIRPTRPVLPPEYRIEEHMTRLDVDNLLVLKSNVCSSKRHPEYGSPMIRALVSSIYKHACHRDLFTIFQQVQTKLVKKLYADEDSERSRNLIVIWNTLPPRKRLYLFPGFDGFSEEAKSELNT